MESFSLFALAILFCSVSCISIKNKISRNPVKIIRDKVVDTIISNPVQKRAIDSHDVIWNLAPVHHYVDDAINRQTRDLHIGDDKEEAAKIRRLIFFSEPHIRHVRQSIEKRDEVLHKLDRSIEDRWKITQSAHINNKVDYELSKKRMVLPFSAVAARVVVPARSENKPLDLSSQIEDTIISEKKRDIHLPVLPY